MGWKIKNMIAISVLGFLLTGCGGGDGGGGGGGQNFTLTVTKTGTGGGTVTSSPAGINCGGDCSESYSSGTAVILTGTADSTSTFAGWSGACSGTGASTTATLDADKTCTATFNLSGGGAALTPTYLFYRGSLIAVDPANPTSPITVETQTIYSPDTLDQVTYNAASLSFSDLHTDTVVYGKGGSLYKVSALKSSGAPTPVQLSNETGATMICDDDGALDASNPNNSQYLYELPGSDGDCNTSSDNLWKMVKQGMTSTDAPIPAKEPVTEIYDFSDGTLIGWLAVDGNNLNRYDANFTSPTPVTSFTTGVVHISSEPTANIFLRVDDKLYRYDTQTGLSNALHTFSSSCCSTGSNTDGAYLYFIDGSSIYRVPLNGSSVASLVFTESTNISCCTDLYLTTNKVVYLIFGMVTTTLKAVDKTGGTPTTLETMTPGSIQVVATAGNLVYYNNYELTSPISVTAKVEDENGVAVATHLNAQWMGASFSTSGTLDQELRPTRLILADGMTGTSMASSTLESFDAAPHTHVATLGTVPFDIINIFIFGVGDNLLVEGFNNSSFSDVFFVNAGTAHSLVRLTDTPTTSEFSVGF